MKFLVFAFVIFALSANLYAQKGVDVQTEKINQASSKTVQTTNDDSNSSSGRVFDFGKDKTVVRQRLANPQRIASRRDILVNSIVEILKEKKLIVDEGASRLSEGVIVTQPYIFARGNVVSHNEINRYAIVPSTDSMWRSGRYTLRIDVESLDGIQNNVSINAKIEGKGGSLISEWTTLESSGQIEEEILVKIVEDITGKTADEVSKEESPKKDLEKKETKPTEKKPNQQF